MMRLKFVFIAFFSLIILAGCSIKETVKNIPDEEMLRERGTTYWGYICREEFDKAYAFEYPLYRKTVGLMDYIRRIRPGMKWRNAEIGKIVVENEAASMKVGVDTEVKMTFPKVAKKFDVNSHMELDEKWVKVDGVWYHVPEK